MTRRAVILAGVLVTLLPVAVQAHELRPGYVELRETEPGIYDVLWKVPARGEGERLSLRLVFDADVQRLSEPMSVFIDNGHIQRWRVQRDGGLADSAVAVDGLAETYTDVLLRLERLDGTEIVHRLTPDQPSYVIPQQPGPGQVAWTYFVLGVEHILLGIDHLLFVVALLLIVSGWGKLIGTITAFTVAHSITLALATLGYVHVPGPPVEAIIALSIVFVAAEAIRGRQGHPGLTARAPWLVAFTFGLLHGFGFAGALSEVGLPQSSIPLALLTFNLGVEAGQLVFVGMFVCGYLVLSRWKVEMPGWAHLIPTYVIGGIAAFWLIERTVGFAG